MRVLHLLVVAALGVVTLASVKPGYTGTPPMWKQLMQLPREARVEAVKGFWNDNTRGILEDQFIAIINAILANPNADPLEIAFIPLNITQDFATLYGSLDTVTATGLSALTIDNLNINPLFLKGDFGFTLPLFNSRGNYDFDAVFGNLLPVYGKGPFTLELTGLMIQASAQLGTSLSGGFIIKTLTLHIELQGIHVNFEMLLGSPALSEVVNDMINDLAMDFFHTFHVSIETAIANSIIKWFNGPGTAPAVQLMEAIRNFPGVAPMAECKPLAGRAECRPLH